MGKQLLKVGTFLVLLFLLVSFINAEITISQLDSSYSLGDNLEATFGVDALKEGYFDVSLVCGDSSMKSELYHGVLTANQIIVSRKLIKTYIGELKGDCYLEAIYGDETKTSETFKIMSEVKIILELNELNYLAGAEVNIKGSAIRHDNQLVGLENNGFVEVTLGNDSKANGVVVDGKFNLIFKTNEETPAGVYPLTIKVYDKDTNGGDVLNYGEAKADLVLSQIPS